MDKKKRWRTLGSDVGAGGGESFSLSFVISSSLVHVHL